MAVDIISLLPPNPYSTNDEALISSQLITSSFDPLFNYIEYVISTPDDSFQTIDYKYSNYHFPTNGTVITSSVSDIIIDPEGDLIKKGFDNGEYDVYYNFYKNELNSSYDNQSYFIKSISSDRTEVIIRSTNPNINLITQINSFKELLFNNVLYFEDFYLNFGDNILAVANNIAIDPITFDIIINLYNPLPNNINVNTPLWIVTKIADSLAFNITFTPEPVVPTLLSFSLRGPNFNLPTKDLINNSTPYTTYNDLITSSLLSTQYSQLNNLISSSGIKINIDYIDFSNFVHFSSAVQRIKNFQDKITQISASQAEINIINSSFSGYTTSSNVNILTNQINNIIDNFDGYEYYLYYNTGSYSWPKSTSTVPYTLYSPTSAQVITWLGNENLNTPSGILGSASIYDDQNLDYLLYTIPEYLRDDPQNEPYRLFIDMVAQSYDNIWIYYKDVTNLHQADNRLDYGISKDLVAEALRSFGVKLYQNNFSSNDLYSAFLGYGARNPLTTPTLPVTANSGQEYINNYITSSYDASVIPLDDINKEVYKRIYHNLPYLAKTKGTIPGLRALINCFGIPDTILRISEFGGRDKDTSTYDYFDQQFNYALDNTNKNPVTSSLILNSNWGAGGNRPESIQFRIKPYIDPDFNISSTQSLFEISGSTSNYTTNLTLWYTGSGLTTSSYSGSNIDPYYQYGTLYLDIKGNLASLYTCSIYAPFFDGNWWSIMVNRSGSFGSDPSFGAHTFTLFAGNTGYYDGYDGNQIMSAYSSSTSVIPTWGYSGSKITFFDTPISTYYPNAGPFSGYTQEIRYWASTQSINSFKDYIMNPQSIDFTGENTYANKLAARLPLGGDLYTGSKSVHPKVSGSWVITSSFASNSDFYINKASSLTTNIESRFLNSPIVGLRGRVTDKIQIVSSSLPTGSVLSQYTSIEQSYPVSGSESPDVNLLEVAFSPQNEVNDDIIDSLGYFNIGEYIGDPRQISSSATSYPDLNTLSNNFFQKYFDTYDLFDYIRLIKYFDNSLFKMIQDFVPARTSLTTGVVIKQHILERNKYPQPKIDNAQFQNINVYSSSLGLSSSFNYEEDLTYEGTIDTAFMSGSTGGTFNQYNVLVPGVGAMPSTVDAPLVYTITNLGVSSSSPINYFAISSSTLYFDNRNIPNQIEFVNGEMVTYFNGKVIIGSLGTISTTGETITVILSSSLQGQITSSIITSPTSTYGYTLYSPYISCSNEERFSLWIQGDAGTIPTSLSSVYFGVYEFLPYSEQTWSQYYTGSTGISTIIHSTQDEFYDGELPGTEYVITDGELNDANDFKYPTTFEVFYNPTLYLSNITSIDDFLNINTSPNQGEVYLWFDTGSTTQPTPPFSPH
jgi:hypothetical protein